MLDRIARLANNRAWLVAGAAMAFTALAGILGGPVSTKLHQGGFTNPHSQSEAATRTLVSATGTRTDRNVIALVQIGAIESTPAKAEVARVASTIAADPDMKLVFTFYQTHDPALVSTDGRETLVFGYFKDVSDDAVAAASTRLQEKFKSDPAVTLGGVGTTFAEVQANVQADLQRAEMIAFPVLFLLMLFVFRGVVAAMLPLMIAGITVLGTFLGLRLVNAETPLSVFALNLATGMGLGLSIDWSLFMVSRFREELRAGKMVADAVHATVRTAGRTVFFSALTVGAAMASLMLFPLNFLYSMGVGGVLLVAVAAGSALLVMPAVLRLLGGRVNALAPKRWQRAEATDHGFWFSLSHLVMRRPVIVAVASGAFLLVLGSPFLKIAFNSVDATTLPASASAHQVDAAIKNDFNLPAAPAVIVVQAGQARAADIAAFRTRVANVSGVESVAPPAYQGNGTWRIDANLGHDQYSAHALQAARDIRALSSDFQVQVGGLTAQFIDLQAGILQTLPVAVLLVTATTLVILFLMTGSLVLPIKSVLMNVLTLGATFGVLVFVFQFGHFQQLLGFTSSGALEQTQPVFIFAIVFGLSTDYGVFLLARIKEARDGGHPNREAVGLGLQRTGRIVTAAAVLFCVALGSFATSNIVFIKELAVGTVVGVLVDATIVRALLVPALMGVLGEWNWWAPRSLRRLHQRIGVSDAPAAPNELRPAVGGSPVS